MTERKKIGIIGSGTIGRAIIDELRTRPEIQISFVLARDTAKLAELDLPDAVLTNDAQVALTCSVDLVIEAAMPSAVADLAAQFLTKADFCAFSSTALADPLVESAIRTAASASGRRFYVPHGAVLGLDGLADAGPLLESVTIVTTKSGKSLGLDPEVMGVVFEGSAREACQRFPRNVNVHAALALAGLGLDRTFSRIVAVPHQTTNEHRIEVNGHGLSWIIEISSKSLGGVTGAYTPQSAIGSINRVLGSTGVCVV